MVNKYGLYFLGALTLFSSFYGAYLKINNSNYANLVLISSSFTTTLLLIYLLVFIKKQRKKIRNL